MIIDGQWYWFTPKEVAHGARCSVTTVYRAIRSGKLDASRKGRKLLLIGEAAVHEWKGQLCMTSFICRVEEAAQRRTSAEAISSKERHEHD